MLASVSLMLTLRAVPEGAAPARDGGLLGLWLWLWLWLWVRVTIRVKSFEWGSATCDRNPETDPETSRGYDPDRARRLSGTFTTRSTQHLTPRYRPH